MLETLKQRHLRSGRNRTLCIGLQRMLHPQGRTQKGGVGVKPPALELDILRNLYYLRKGDQLFSHTFCLLICRLNANTME